jgi:adenylylsulfate kinase-like enzyme
VVIVVTGPIASGKSTIARELARELGRAQVRAVVIDLDLLYDMLAADGPKDDDAMWALARRVAATMANTLLNDGVAAVIAEGSFNMPGDRAAFARHLGASVVPLYVTLRVSYDEALRRAQDDPTRGLSRDPRFLAPYFAGVGPTLAATPATDIVIDTEQTTAISAAAEIAGHVLPTLAT